MTAFRRPGVRFLAEAVVIVATAVISGFLHLGAVGIGAAVALVWAVAAVIEYSLSHPRERKVPEPPVETLPAAEPVASEAVRILPRVPEPVVVIHEPEPELELEPEPVAVEPEPESELPVPEPVASEPGVPQEWNVWEIERALRADGEISEEQEFLLIYLRDFAGPDGSLPVHFDELIRESFSNALGALTG